jgi:hypothetical protein
VFNQTVKGADVYSACASLYYMNFLPERMTGI